MFKNVFHRDQALLTLFADRCAAPLWSGALRDSQHAGAPAGAVAARCPPPPLALALALPVVRLVFALQSAASRVALRVRVRDSAGRVWRIDARHGRRARAARIDAPRRRVRLVLANAPTRDAQREWSTLALDCGALLRSARAAFASVDAVRLVARDTLFALVALSRNASDPLPPDLLPLSRTDAAAAAVDSTALRPAFKRPRI